MYKRRNTPYSADSLEEILRCRRRKKKKIFSDTTFNEQHGALNEKLKDASREENLKIRQKIQSNCREKVQLISDAIGDSFKEFNFGLTPITAGGRTVYEAIKKMAILFIKRLKKTAVLFIK
ncbi:hypothetical protein ACUH97_01195 [Dermabacteraceae bacterium P13088]